jgi:predicted transposase YbfD/YdcC
MVSAFAARQRLVLGQVKVADKGQRDRRHPQAAGPAGDRRGDRTIDAMGCQRAIAQKIIDKKADYVLALKGNQGSLHEDVKLFLAEQSANGFQHTTISRDRTVDADHGRIETRDIAVIHDVTWLQKRHAWPGLNAVVMVEGSREFNHRIERETRLYLTSLTAAATVVG